MALPLPHSGQVGALPPFQGRGVSMVIDFMVLLVLLSCDLSHQRWAVSPYRTRGHPRVSTNLPVGGRRARLWRTPHGVGVSFRCEASPRCRGDLLPATLLAPRGGRFVLLVRRCWPSYLFWFCYLVTCLISGGRSVPTGRGRAPVSTSAVTNSGG